MITAKVVAMHGPSCKGAFTNYVDTFLAFFDHLSPFVDIFYLIMVDKKPKFLITLLLVNENDP